jgi:hypothetical protein
MPHLLPLGQFTRRRKMRKQHRVKALFGVLSMSAGLLTVNPLVGATPAHAWSRYDAAPTAENLEALRWCESTNDYAADTGNGYYGAYQFDLSTWQWLGYEGWPSDAAPEVQDQAVLDLYDYSNWDSWPSCSRWLGLKYSYR